MLARLNLFLFSMVGGMQRYVMLQCVEHEAKQDTVQGFI